MQDEIQCVDGPAFPFLRDGMPCIPPTFSSNSHITVEFSNVLLYIIYNIIYS